MLSTKGPFPHHFILVPTTPLGMGKGLWALTFAPSGVQEVRELDEAFLDTPHLGVPVLNTLPLHYHPGWRVYCAVPYVMMNNIPSILIACL